MRHADVNRIGLCHVLPRKSESGATIRNGQQCGETKCRRKGQLAMVRGDSRGLRSLPLYPAELRAPYGSTTYALESACQRTLSALVPIRCRDSIILDARTISYGLVESAADESPHPRCHCAHLDRAQLGEGRDQASSFSSRRASALWTTTASIQNCMARAVVDDHGLEHVDDARG